MLRPKRDQTYAELRYRTGLRNWRRWTRTHLLVILGPVFVAAVAWGVAEHNEAAFMAGFIAGGSAALFLAVREYAPAYVETWGQGSEGERKTKRVLEEIGWSFVEDVDTGRGNYDHVAVGPPGVFMLESKNLTGVTEVRNNVAWLRRRHDPYADKPIRVESAVLSASAAVSRTITAGTGRREWVHAVVVFWNEFPERLVESDRIVFVHGDRLSDYLQERPARLVAPGSARSRRTRARRPAKSQIATPAQRTSRAHCRLACDAEARTGGPARRA
jgi:hypothetical protein